MNTPRNAHALCRALLVACIGLGATFAQAAPTHPDTVASNTVTRPTSAHGRASSHLADELIPASPRRGPVAARPAKGVRGPAPAAPPVVTISAKRGGPQAPALIEDAMGVLMDLGGYTWQETKGSSVRRAGVLVEQGDTGLNLGETAHVPTEAGQPHAVAPDLLFALLVEATRTQQSRIETLEAEALELRLALADATEARESQDRAIAAIQSKLGIKP